MFHEVYKFQFHNKYKFLKVGNGSFSYENDHYKIKTIKREVRTIEL